MNRVTSRFMVGALLLFLSIRGGASVAQAKPAPRRATSPESRDPSARSREQGEPDKANEGEDGRGVEEGEPVKTAVAPRRGGRKKRVAVLLVKGGDAELELVDSLTEWILARLAAKGNYDMVGKEAFRAKIGSEEERVFACVSNRTCLSNVATALSLDLILVGTLGVRKKGKKDQEYRYQLYLINAVSAKEIKRVNGTVKGKTENLGPALDKAITELLKPPVKPGGLIVKCNVAGAKIHLDDRFVGSAPAAMDKVKPGKYRLRVVGQDHYIHRSSVTIEEGRIKTVEVKLIRRAKPRKSWLFYTAWTTAGVAVATGIAAAVVGGLSRRTQGETQLEVLDDWDRRKKMALSANALIGAASAVALTSAAVFLFGWKRFTVNPETPKGAEPSATGASIAPAGGGSQTWGRLSW